MGPPDAFHYEGQDLEALADLPGYYRWILERFHPEVHGRVLEVGAGVGNFARAWLPLAREAVLVEPAPNLHDTLRARFAGDPRVRTVHGTLENAQSVAPADGGIRGEVFDAALLVNVLEHVPDDVGLLRALHSTLRPGGAMLVFTPALPWLYGSLDRLVHHVRRYTRTSLAGALRDAGFQVESVRYFDSAGVLPWFIVGRVLRSQRFSTRAATVYDRVAVPVVSALERRFSPPFGKNLVGVARRSAAPVTAVTAVTGSTASGHGASS